MAVFQDDFQRANGAPGGNWVSMADTPTISGGLLVGTSGTFGAYDTTVSDTSFLSAQCHMYYTPSTTWFGGPLVKAPASGLYGYFCRIFTVSTTVYLELVSLDNGTYTTLAQTQITTPVPPYVDLYIEWDHGHLTARYSTYTVEYNHNGYAANGYAGIWGRTGYASFADVTFVTGTAISLAVDPDVIPNYGECTDLALTGVNTSWTPGTPGSPTFTVNHGTISAQTVHSSTSATITYCPGDYLGAIIITDPSTAATVGAVVSSDPGTAGPPGAYGLSPYAVAMLNNTAGESLVEILTKPNTPLTVDAETELSVETLLGRVALYTGAKVTPSGVPDAGILDTLWILTNGRYDPVVGPYPTPETTTVDKALGDILTALDTLITANNWTLGDVIVQLAGNGVPTHADILTAIAGIEGGSNQDVLDALAVLRGDDQATVAAVITLLEQLSTVAGYDLSDVLTAISAIPTNPVTSLQPVLDKLDDIQPSTSYSLTSVTDLVTSLTDDVADVSLELAAVKAIVEGLAAALLGTASGPVWPGLANVTLGDPIALSNGLVVDGPMHGVIVTIDTHPAGAGKYVFGTVTSWTHAGALIFYSDRNDYERAESFGLDSQLINPRTMQEAAGCIVRLTNGWTGTIRTWNRSA